MQNVHFLTIENNSSVKVHHRLCTAYQEENVMNIRSVQWWQLMFWERRTNMHINEHEGWLTMMCETVWCVCILLEANHHLTITDMQRVIKGHFSHEVGYATIVNALQLLKMQKVCTHWVPRQLTAILKILHGSGIQLPNLVWRGWEWFTWENNYLWWK